MNTEQMKELYAAGEWRCVVSLTGKHNWMTATAPRWNKFEYYKLIHIKHSEVLDHVLNGGTVFMHTGASGTNKEAQTYISFFGHYNQWNTYEIINTMKYTCSRCKTEKDISDFRRDKSRPNGISSNCKECRKGYERTIDGLISRMFLDQLRYSKNRGYSPPKYTKEEFSAWAKSNVTFIELYSKWQEADYNKMSRPSIDRLDDYKEYSFDNIQVLTWEENKAKGHLDAKEGRNNKHNKTIIQFDKDWNFVARFHSSREASRQTGISQCNISLCANKKRESAGNYIWRFEDEVSE